MLRRRLHQWLRARVHLALDPLSAERDGLIAATAASKAAAGALERRLSALARQAKRLADDLALLDQPFSDTLTMDQVLRRHPAAAAVLAQHHLPACGGCAVRFDETLAEAAEAYELDLTLLLQDLRRLL